MDTLIDRPTALVPHLVEALDRAPTHTRPFRHWMFRSFLDEATARAVVNLPFRSPEPTDTHGRRETLNAVRVFFNPEACAAHQAARAVAEGFQASETVAAFERLTGQPLAGCYTRVEYCQDPNGFWLEPHLDISAKKLSLIIYLSEGPGAETMGTDMFDAEHRPAGRAPAPFNSAFLFIPGKDTWHGFIERPIRQIRKSLIVNYVVADWRQRGELAFPDEAVRGG